MPSLFAATVFAAVVGIAAAPAAARARQGSGGEGPRYDTSTELTLRGTIEEVREVADATRGRSATGLHLVVKTEKETIEVHLGPATFIAEQKMSLNQGDAVEIVGSRVKLAAGDAVIAREIRKGTQTVTLRDDKGIPKWSRGRRQ
jgi:hypothetical protein